MSDNKLTDDKIINAVKSYEEKLLSNGLKCLEPFEVREIVERQQEEIKRLQSEIEEKDKNYIELLKISSERAEIIGKQNAEIMRLQKLNDEILDRYDKCIDKYDSIVQKQSAENERLKEQLNHSIGTNNTKNDGCFPFD